LEGNPQLFCGIIFPGRTPIPHFWGLSNRSPVSPNRGRKVRGGCRGLRRLREIQTGRNVAKSERRSAGDRTGQIGFPRFRTAARLVAAMRKRGNRNACGTDEASAG
jgi:hypothetical protein